MAYGWSTLKRYDVSDRVSVFIKYKQFDRISKLVEERRIEVLDKQISQRQTAENRYIARSIRLLIDTFDIKPRYERGSDIPVEIALEGNPSIAVYLCGVLNYDITQVAKKMGITEETVKKYILRLEEPPYWSFDPDYEARFEVD
jgi:hypothetical protein